MAIHLPKDLESSINEAVTRGHFASMDDAMTEAAQLLLEKLKQGQTVPPATGSDAPTDTPQGLLEMVDELRKKVPPEEFSRLPTDGAKQLDHYIYGIPKRADA
jgi:Arc/MetJ-type ribon-helix-helix transcriptional regulator